MISPKIPLQCSFVGVVFSLVFSCKMLNNEQFLTICSLQKRPSLPLLATKRDVCSSATEIPYWWGKLIFTVTWFQVKCCSIVCFSRSIMVKFCVPLWTSSSETQMLLVNKNTLHEYWRFCSRFLAFTFDLFVTSCLFSVKLKQFNYYVDQSEILILDRIYVISMEFLWLRCRRHLCRNVSSSERRLFSQALLYNVELNN